MTKVYKNVWRRRQIILLAIIISIVLYMLGVFSGLYANKVIGEKTTSDISGIRQETQISIEALKKDVDFLDQNVKSTQLEQSFVETLNHQQMCRFYNLTVDDLLGTLSGYWQKLPYRLEEYETDNTLSEEYLLLKQQYNLLAIKTWILARNKYIQCNTDIMPGLYFYSSNCSMCIQQGRELDLFQESPVGSKKVLIFTIDLNSDDQMVRYLKDYYGITSAPAIILDERVFFGRLFTNTELRAVFSDEAVRDD